MIDNTTLNPSTDYLLDGLEEEEVCISLNPSICTNNKTDQNETFVQVEDVFDDSEYYKRLAKAKAKAEELMSEKPHDLLFEVTSHRNHKILNILPDDVLVELFDRLPPLTTEEAYEELGHFKTLGNGMFKYHYQNLMLETLLKARSLSLNSSTCTNNKSTDNETFLLVEALFDGVGEEEQGFTTPSPSILEDDDNTDDLSFNSSICTNNRSTKNETFVQVNPKKWTLQQNLYHPESIAYLITNECWARIKATKDEMEDVISDALVQYYELEANGEIDYEKAAQYWVRTAVNKTINKYKFDKADKRREVETVAKAEPEQLKQIETYDNLDSWYQSLSKSQKSAVDDAKRKIEKGQKIGPALRKRLSRVPRPVWGEIERNYGTSSLRDEHAELRYEHERVKSIEEEKELLKQVKKKRRTSTLKLKINAAGQNGQSQTPIPHDSTQISEPQTAGEGKDTQNVSNNRSELTAEANLSVEVIWWNHIVKQKPETQHLLDADEQTRYDNIDSEVIMATLHNLANDSEYKRKVNEWKSELASSLTGDKLMEYRKNILKTKKPGELERLFLTKERILELSW